MPTRNIIPRKDDEGSLGITSRQWKSLYATTVNATDVNVDSLKVNKITLNDKVLDSFYPQSVIDEKLDTLSIALNTRIDAIDASVQDFDDFVKDDELQEELNKYITTDRFNATIINFLDSTALDNYYDKDTVDTTLASYVQIDELVNYYDKDTVDNALSQYVLSSELLDYTPLTTLENYYDKDEIEIKLNDYLTTYTFDKYYTKAEVDNKLTPISSKLNILSNKVNILDVDNLVTKTELSQSKITDINNLDFSSVLTTTSIATDTNKSNKIVLTNSDGVLPVNITGSSERIVDIPITVSNIQDKQTLLYDEETHSFTNKEVVTDLDSYYNKDEVDTKIEEVVNASYITRDSQGYFVLRQTE